MTVVLEAPVVVLDGGFRLPDDCGPARLAVLAFAVGHGGDTTGAWLACKCGRWRQSRWHAEEPWRLDWERYFDHCREVLSSHVTPPEPASLDQDGPR